MLTRTTLSTEQRFEQTLAFHCAPAMAGIKPADLISWPAPLRETLALLGSFSQSLERAGIRFRLLSCCRGRCLILVYRPDRLEEQLKQEDVRGLLRRDGYPVDGGVPAMLDHLGAKMLSAQEFPHEVGLFLGYPAEDVEGFRKNRGRDFKYSGLWKVYSDVERAQKCFQRYSCCRRALCRRVGEGCRLAQIFQAV